MSRIHEALKKAEQERAATLSADLATPSAGSQILATPVVGGSAPAAPGYLRFDDLVSRCARPHWHLDPNANVFFHSDLNSPGSEQFRTLRSRLYQLRASQPLRTLLVTSSVPAEGKTFVANNLAQAIIRQPDRRALIIDADIRCSRLHVPLGAPAAPGLTDYLRGDADEMMVIQHGQEGGLCFIPGGNEVTNPSELISSGRLKTLLDRVSPVFDWVILDSPPCIPVADASMLADLCDGIIVVVRAGSTPSQVALRGCQELQGRNVIGVVLNAVEEGSHYDSYYQSYGYGYGDHRGGELSK